MRKVFLYISFISIISFNSCERDDLCTPDQATTPRLVVVFKDITNPTLVKEVPALEVREIGSSEFAPLDFEGSVRLTDADTVYLPLRNNFDLTTYNFINTTNSVTLNSTVNFSYNRTEELVSRACGFRTIYGGLESDIEASGGWISDVDVVNPAITNNFQVHVEVFH